jgi:hypothetical protein
MAKVTKTTSKIVSNKFAVQIDGYNLDAAARKRVSAAIGSAVDAEIARMDTRGDAVLTRLPPGLDGKWIRRLSDVQQLIPDNEFRF